ncbi:hypothetical protein [Amycolatopsis benzoatilytica]|nr:hypothetical protein [Amycolatopsis benzoatilytica]
MGIFDKKDDGDRKPPLANVIGSKGKGGWFGKKDKKDKKDDKKKYNGSY